MAEKDTKTAPELAELQAENAELRAALAKLQEQVQQLVGARPPTKAELRDQKDKAEAEKRAAMAERDAKAKDMVTIQKFNRDGDISRERVCARVDVAAFERQGYKVKK